MQNFKETGFIKSYPALLKLPITISEKSLIELVMSFTDNKNTFYMNYEDIATYLGFTKSQSVKNLVCNLKKKGYITTEQSHNYNGLNGGSSTSIVVNEDFINKKLDSIKTKADESIAIEISNDIESKEPNAVLMEIFDITVENDNDVELEYSVGRMPIIAPQSNDDEDFNVKTNEGKNDLNHSAIISKTSVEKKIEVMEIEAVETVQYNLDEVVNLYEVLPKLSFTTKETGDIISDINFSKIEMNVLVNYISKQKKEQNDKDYCGVPITSTTVAKLKGMIAR